MPWLKLSLTLLCPGFKLHKRLPLSRLSDLIDPLLPLLIYQVTQYLLSSLIRGTTSLQLGVGVNQFVLNHFVSVRGAHLCILGYFGVSKMEYSGEQTNVVTID